MGTGAALSQIVRILRDTIIQGQRRCGKAAFQDEPRPQRAVVSVETKRHADRRCRHAIMSERLLRGNDSDVIPQ
jgi:hypothetical protein